MLITLYIYTNKLVSYMADIKQQVGQQIREARKAKGYTQKEVSEKLGISEGSYNRYENGSANLSIETIQRVAHVLGTKITVNAE